MTDDIDQFLAQGDDFPQVAPAAAPPRRQAPPPEFTKPVGGANDSWFFAPGRWGHDDLGRPRIPNDKGHLYGVFMPDAPPPPGVCDVPDGLGAFPMGHSVSSSARVLYLTLAAGLKGVTVSEMCLNPLYGSGNLRSRVSDLRRDMGMTLFIARNEANPVTLKSGPMRWWVPVERREDCLRFIERCCMGG